MAAVMFCSRFRVCSLRRRERFIDIKIGASSITDYCTRIERLADDLEDIDSPVLENDLVIYTVNDLTNRFDYIASVIRHKSPLPSFSETRSMLLLEESIFLLLNHIIMLPDIFFKARIPTNDIQVLGVDYQLLSNPVKGEAYHKIGKSGAPDDTLVDHAAVFGMLFGSDSFEDYIGQLYMASLLEEVGQAPEILQMKVPKGMREFQKERETKLITILKNRLQPFVKGHTTEFVNWATSEARQLSEACV